MDIEISHQLFQAVPMSAHSSIIIRPFEKADLSALSELIISTIEISYQTVYPPRAIDFFKQFHSEERILERAASGTVLVVEQDGELVATASLSKAEILAVFVDPELQGIGLGKRLMKLLEDQARENGATEMVLSISLPSKRFYESLGYQVVEERSRDVGCGQLLKFWMGKKRIFPEVSDY